MQKRKFDELISHFNRKVSDMSIDQKYKMELLGMISAIGFAHEKELGTNLAEVGTDCISREQAIDAIEAGKIKHGDYLTSSYVGYEMAEKVVKQLPPIQPKRGKWIDTTGNTEWYAREYECSECGGTMLGESNFCPNCGAKMEVTT